MGFDFSTEAFPQGCPPIDAEHVPGNEFDKLPKFSNADRHVRAVQVGKGRAEVSSPTGLRVAEVGDWIVWYSDDTVGVVADEDFNEWFKKGHKSAEKKPADDKSASKK